MSAMKLLVGSMANMVRLRRVPPGRPGLLTFMCTGALPGWAWRIRLSSWVRSEVIRSSRTLSTTGGSAPFWAAVTSRTSSSSALKDTVVLPSLVSDLRIFPVTETTASGIRAWT